MAVRLGKSEAGSRPVGVVTGAYDVDDSLNIRKNVLAGEYDSTVRVEGLPLVTLRPNSVDTAEAPAAMGEGVLTTYTLPEYETVRITEVTEKPTSARPNLEEAAIVVAAGRGIGGNLAPIEDLADALGAAIGSTRAVTDAGWLDHSTQIGQTGKSVFRTIRFRGYFGGSSAEGWHGYFKDYCRHQQGCGRAHIRDCRLWRHWGSFHCHPAGC